MPQKSGEMLFAFPNPEFDAEVDRVRAEVAPIVSPVMEEVVKLETEIDQIEFHQGLSTTKVVGDSLSISGRQINPSRAGLTETEFARASLRDQTQRLRSTLLQFASQMEDLKFQINTLGRKDHAE